jgi:hypothetical protein
MRILRLMVVLCLMAIVGATQAQVIYEAPHDEDILVDLTVQPSVGYQVYAYEIALELEYSYLGEAFDFNVSVYDSSGQALYDGAIADYASAGVEIASDEYLVVFSVAGDQSGRARVRFNTVSTSHESLLPPNGTSIYDWLVSGSVIDPIFADDKLCAHSSDPEDAWYFSAPPAIVERVQMGYGDTLGFGLEHLSDFADQLSVWLVVGNGIVLEYPLTRIDRERSFHVVPLRANAGWYDVDGSFTDIDGELFQQMLSDVTQVLIQGSDNACLIKPEVYLTTSTASHVPFYALTYDERSGGLPSGCDGYLVEQSRGVIYSDDPAENIRASLEALFAFEPTDDSELVNYLYQGLTVESVTVEDGFATVEIGGTLMQVGSCVDGTIATQILLSVFSNPDIQRAMIITNGSNMKPQFDMSDMTPEDEEYTPADFSLRLY